MKRTCPITHQVFEATEGQRYSREGLRSLSPRLKGLARLPYSESEQLQEVVSRAGKMSVQGVQPKLSAVLKVKDGVFELVDRFGKFILKPPTEAYPHLPENEALTMHLARTVGIKVPDHGLIQGKDDSWTYFIRRFDRAGRKGRLAVEDFSQLTGQDRNTKYDSSMEKVAAAVGRFTTFPLVENLDLYRRTIFFFLTGGEDMHLKNFSLITMDKRIQLTPAYDFLNSTIAIRNPVEEFALSLNGKKKNLTRRDLVEYFGQERLGLTEEATQDVMHSLEDAIQNWPAIIARSFLPEEHKDRYLDLVRERWGRFQG